MFEVLDVQSAKKVAIFRNEPADAVGAWSFAGSAGGDILALEVDPSNPSTVYAATRRGVFRSLDGATSWQNIGLDISPEAFGFLSLVCPRGSTS